MTTKEDWSEMVERGARILEPQAWAALGDCDTLAYRSRRTASLRKARAFIEAMREPTEAMVSVGNSTTAAAFAPAVDVWQAMIDAALQEPRT
jgi:hypothetical protein